MPQVRGMGAWSGKVGEAKPVNIVRVRDMPDSFGRSFIVNEQEISRYLLAPNTRRLPVVVIAVAGVARTGKSFFLTFLLRYAVMRFLEGSTEEHWMGDETTQMGGFEFVSSTQYGTNGIMMWPQLFECTTQAGEKLCVLLVDTPGTYYGEGASTIWATLFAFSILISSLLIYNVEEEIGEEDLQSLELDLGFARLVPELFAGMKPGQKLLFLVRDFKLKEEYKCGSEGSNRYLREKVFGKEVDEMHQEVRDHIVWGFEKIECSTLPYPGRVVVESSAFKGKMKDIDSRFKHAAAIAVEKIMGVDNLVVKRVNNRPITVEMLYDHILQIVHSFNSLQLPTVVSPLRALADQDHEKAMEAAVKMYVAKMEASGCNSTYIPPKKLENHHEDALDRAIKFFHGKLKIGQGERITPFHLTKLHNTIIKKYDEYLSQNDARITCVYNELPFQTVALLLFCSMLEGYQPFFSAVTKWIKLMLLIKLVNWVRLFYTRWLHDEE